jgi:hypothetical protein
MFCAPGLIFGSTEDVGSRFHVLRSQTRFHVLRSRTSFRLYRGLHIPFSCFARPDTFSAIPRASGPFFNFFAPGLVFYVTEGVGSRFHVLRAGLVFGGTEGVGYGFHVLRAGLVFGCTEGVGSRLQVLRAWTLFRRYRGRRVPFSRFTLSDSFSAIPRSSGPIFMICAPGLVFGGVEGVRSFFHVLRSRTHFQRYRGRQVPFSSFARTHSFSAVPRASGPTFMFYARRFVFGGTEGVRSCFHVFRSRTRFLPVPRASGPVFMFCPPGLIFGGTEGVGSRFHVLPYRTHFRRYRGRRVPFSCFALPDTFSAVLRT